MVYKFTSKKRNSIFNLPPQLLCTIFMFVLVANVNAQSIGIGTNTPDPSTKLHIEDSNKGVLIPRVSIPNLNAAAPVTAPATALLVYNTNTTSGEGFHYWNGTQWVKLVDGIDHDWYEVGTTTAPDDINDNIYTQGNVGIGTVNPNANLHIQGALNAPAVTRVNQVGTDQYTGFTVDRDGAEKWFLGMNTTDNDLIFRTGGASDQMVIKENGNVGIGLTAPTQKLDVQGGNARINNAFIGDVGHGTQWAGFTNENQASTTGYSLLAEDNGNHTLINKENTGTGYIGFRVGNVDQAAILNNGNMGIGTTTPSEKLEVAGDIKFTGGDLKTDAFGLITPLFVRGSGANNSSPTGRQIKLGNDILPINNSRGLNLTIIDAATHTLISNTTFDTYISTAAVDALAVALSNTTRNHICILTSRDAWEPRVNNNLRLQARRLGLFKIAGMNINDFLISQGRFPYVAIFRGVGTGTNNALVNRQVLEVIGTEEAGGPQGLDVATWLMDGGFSGGSVPSALVNPDPDVREPVVFVNTNNRVGIMTVTPTHTLSVSGSASKTGGGAWATFSDQRVKKDVQPYTDGLKQVLQIQPKSFQYNGKGGYDADGKTYYGVIAQEIEKIAPYTVSQIATEDFEDQRVYDGTALTYMLINSVQEQQTMIQKQQTMIEQLIEQNNTQTQAITNLQAKVQVLSSKEKNNPVHSEASISSHK